MLTFTMLKLETVCMCEQSNKIAHYNSEVIAVSLNLLTMNDYVIHITNITKEQLANSKL